MKKQLLFGVILLMILVGITPNNVTAKEEINDIYQNKDSELIYKINNETKSTINNTTNKAADTAIFGVIETYEEKEVGYNLTDSNKIYRLADGAPEGTDGWVEGYDQDQDCTGNDSILGSYDDEDSVAWLLQKLFNYLKLAGPFIVVVMSGVDFAKVVVTGDDDGMKKAQSKLITRLILAASLFFLPDLLSALLELFNITSSGICGLQ